MCQVSHYNMPLLQDKHLLQRFLHSDHVIGSLPLTSASWDREISTRVLAAGCTTSSNFMMVAPSLEMVVFPVTNTQAKHLREKKCVILKPGWRGCCERDGFEFWTKFLVVHLPWLSTMSLSIPLGPRVEPMASTTTSQALMLLIIWGLPWDESVPSFNKIMGGR